jgi:hypothetical protein
MKFYKDKNEDNYYDNYWSLILDKKLNAIYMSPYFVGFFKNGKYNNIKNAAYIRRTGSKDFCLNTKYYGDSFKFTKQSWRRFVKMQVFL